MRKILSCCHSCFWFSLPNLLAGRALVPEFIQEAVDGPALGAAVLEQLQPGRARDELLRYRSSFRFSIVAYHPTHITFLATTLLVD